MPEPAANSETAIPRDQGRGPIRDDSGRRTGLLTIKDLRRAAQDRPELRLTADRLRHAIKSEKYNMGAGAQLRSVGAVLFVLIGAPIFAQILMVAAPNALGLGGALLIAYPVFIAIVIIVQRALSKRRSSKQIAYTAVAEGVCGSCAFSLEGAPVVRATTPRCPRCRAPVTVFTRCGACKARFARPIAEEADCVTCGECGSLWLRSRITRPHWDQPVHDSIRSLWYAWFMPGLRPRHASITPDDRGRFVYVPDPRLLRVPPEAWPRLETSRRRLARQTRHVGWGWRVGTAAPFAILAGLCVWWLTDELSQPNWDGAEIAAISVFIGMLMIPVLVSMVSALGRPPRTTARRLVGLGLCGSCLKPLEGITPDVAGIVDCPTCGASWQAAAPRASGPPSPPAAIPSSDADGHEHPV